eukprot:s1589_g5.t1
MDADSFCQCIALISSPSLLPEQRRALEASLLQLRRSPGAVDVCSQVLLGSDACVSYHAANTLKYAVLFSWPYLSEALREKALHAWLSALSPPKHLSASDWRPVKNEALEAVALYFKKVYIVSNELPSAPHFSLDVAAAFLSALQDGRNLSPGLGLLAASVEAQQKAQQRFARFALLPLLRAAAAEAHWDCLIACANCEFSEKSTDWQTACAEVALAISARGDWDLALQLAAQCPTMPAMWNLVVDGASSRPANISAATSCASRLLTDPSPGQRSSLARTLIAARLMQVDFNSDEGLSSYDSLVVILQVISRQRDPELTDYLLENFFQHILLQANVPDAYDETLGTSAGTSSGHDLLTLIARIGRDCHHITSGLRQLLSQPLDNELAMDVRHVSLCFASEFLEVSDEALCLAAAVSTQTKGLSSPLLVADSLRFFQRVCRRGVLFSDKAQIFRVALGLLNAEVVQEGLAVLTEVSKSADSRVLFAAHFQEVWSNPQMPLSLVNGFCRCMRNCADVAELVALAGPLRQDVLKQLAEWDPRYVNGHQLALTERRFGALGGLAPLGNEFEQPIIHALQTRLCGQYPEHLLPCAAPLLAALAKSGSECGLRLAESVCVPMATLPAESELQEHTLDLCEVLLEAPATCVSEALVVLWTKCCDCHVRRCFELMSKAPLTQRSFECLSVGLGHPDGHIQQLAVRALTDRPFQGDVSDMLPRVLQIAVYQDGPLLEHLADLFLVYTTASALMAAASKLVVGITDHILRAMVLQSFEKLSTQHEDPKAHFLRFVAEMRALTLQAADAVADRAARSGKPPKEVALAAREAAVTAGLTKESLMVQTVGSAATRAVAAEMARKQAGWHEIAAAAVEAAQDSSLPAEFVPRMAATAAAEQAAKEAARQSKSGHEVGLAAAAATQACGVPATLAGDVAGRAIASALLQSGSGLATMEDAGILGLVNVERPMPRRVLDRLLRNEAGAGRLQRHESCWKCFMRCFCLTPSREVHFEAAQAQHAAVVQSLALITAEYSHGSPSFATWTAGLKALLTQAQEEEDAEFDRFAPSFCQWPALNNVLLLGVTPPEGKSEVSDGLLLDVARLSAHAARFALAAYSNRLYGLVSPGAACLTLACCISERRAFVRMSGISDDDVLLAETVARPFKPVWWICHDRATSAIMVAVRGTFSMSDVLSDVLATQVLYKEHVIHEGVLASARWVYSKVAPVLRREMASEGGKILITGHSLGGAVAALLAWLLREDAGLPARAFVFGVPQVTDEALARKMAKFVTGIIHARDIIPMLSQKSVEDLRHQVAEAAQTPEEKLLELQAVLANFHLPTEPALLQDALSQRQFQAPTPRRHTSTSTSTTVYEDAPSDVAELPAIPMHNPGDDGGLPDHRLYTHNSFYATSSSGLDYAVDWDDDGHSELIVLQWDGGDPWDDPPREGRHCWVRYFRQDAWQLNEQLGEENPFRDLRFQMNSTSIEPAFSVVDWDGDGDLDWILRDDEGLWFLEFSAGTIRSKSPIGLFDNLGQPIPANYLAVHFAAVDWDQDGDLDLFISDPLPLQSAQSWPPSPWPLLIHYFERVNESSLVEARSPLDGFDASSVKSMVVADFDGDGEMDVLFSNYATYSCEPPMLGFLHGTEDGNFEDWSQNGRANPFWGAEGAGYANCTDFSGAALAVADANQNGLLELLVATRSRIFLFSWHFTKQLVERTNGYRLFHINVGRFRAHPAVADWDGDGIRDLILGLNGRFLVYLRQEDGSLSGWESVLELDVKTAQPAVLDFNNDSLIDLIVPISTWEGRVSELIYFERQLNGSLEEKFRLKPSWALCSAAAVADWSQDGRLDVLLITLGVAVLSAAS